MAQHQIVQLQQYDRPGFISLKKCTYKWVNLYYNFKIIKYLL